MPQSLQNILLSQCRGLKLALAVVCHFLNVLLLIWHPQRLAYENENSTIFCCVIFSLQFLLLVGNLSFAHCFYVCYHSTHISTPCRLAKTDSSVNGLSHRGHRDGIQFLRRDCKLSLPFCPAARAPQESLLAA